MTFNGGAASVGTGGVVFSFDTQTNTETIIHSFPYSTPADGYFPNGSLVQFGSALYGMTTYGTRSVSLGVIFAIDTRDNTERVIHSFDDYGNNGYMYDGEHPFGSLIVSGNLLYGMTTEGGDTGVGVIFRMTRSQALTRNFSHLRSLTALRPGATWC